MANNLGNILARLPWAMLWKSLARHGGDRAKPIKCFSSLKQQEANDIIHGAKHVENIQKLWLFGQNLVANMTKINYYQMMHEGQQSWVRAYVDGLDPIIVLIAVVGDSEVMFYGYQGTLIEDDWQPHDKNVIMDHPQHHAQSRQEEEDVMDNRDST
ncbi:hypothetical protein ACJX0J_012487 [Zea mays]